MLTARKYVNIQSLYILCRSTNNVINSGLVVHLPPTLWCQETPSKLPKVCKIRPILAQCSLILNYIGTPKFFDIAGASGKNNRHFFCGTCGSNLFGELDIMGDKTVIKAGSLDNGEASLRNKVDIEFFVKDRVSYLAAVDVAKQEPRFG